MLAESVVRPISKVSARDLLINWLEENASGVSYSPENGVKLADMYPGFVDVSYLMNVWKEIIK